MKKLWEVQKIFFGLLFLFGVVSFEMNPVFAEENYIALRGKGVVNVLPDIAVLRLSIKTEGKNTQEAKKGK